MSHVQRPFARQIAMKLRRRAISCKRRVNEDGDSGRYGCGAFLLLRLVKPLVKLMGLLALGFVALVAWGNFWPAPNHAPRINCPPHLSDPCRVVTGRVLYHTAFGTNHRTHPQRIATFAVV